VKPLRGLVLVEPEPSTTVASGGFGTQVHVAMRPGQALAVHEGRLVRGKTILPQVKVGDRVLYTVPAGPSMTVGEDILIPEINIMAILEEA